MSQDIEIEIKKFIAAVKKQIISPDQLIKQYQNHINERLQQLIARITASMNQQHHKEQTTPTQPTYAEKLAYKTGETLIIKKKSQTITTQQVEKEIHGTGVEDLAIEDCLKTKSGNRQIKYKGKKSKTQN